MDELNNIWNADDELNEEQFMNYIKGNLNEEDAHRVEKKMAGSSFVNDGIEGLQQFSSAEKINAYVQQVNEKLHHNLADKKRKSERKIAGLSWEIIAVILVILLCLLGYGIIEMMRK
jgi:hypothetical protein